MVVGMIDDGSVGAHAAKIIRRVRWSWRGGGFGLSGEMPWSRVMVLYSKY